MKCFYKEKLTKLVIRGSFTSISYIFASDNEVESKLNERDLFNSELESGVNIASISDKSISFKSRNSSTNESTDSTNLKLQYQVELN